MDFINVVKKARKHLGISQTQLSKDMGKTRAWVSLCETYKAGFTANSKIEIAKALIGRIDNKVLSYQEEIKKLYRLKGDLEDALDDAIYDD